MGVGYDDDIDQDRALEECPLDDGLRLVAKQELREDDVIRAHSLRAMRNWIRKHPDIVTCRTGNYSRIRVIDRFRLTKGGGSPAIDDRWWKLLTFITHIYEYRYRIRHYTVRLGKFVFNDKAYGKI